MTRSAPEVTPARKGPVRRLYDWMLHWAETPHGPVALAGLSAAESSFFPIPPDPLLVALALGASKKALRFAAICTAASVVGGLIGYLIGAGLWGALAEPFFRYVPGVTPEAFERVRSLYDRYDFWAIFLAGLTPLPYKVFTIAAGVASMALLPFTLASLVGRGARFFLVAGLMAWGGERMEGALRKYVDRIGWATVAAVVVGVLVYRAG